MAGATLSRFFALHTIVLPALLASFVGVHMYLVLYHGISEPPKAGKPVDPDTYQDWYHDMLEKEGKPYWPDAVWKEILFATGVIIVVAVLSFFLGPRTLGAPPDPTFLIADPRPDWYFLWYYALLEVKPRSFGDLFMVYMPLALGVGLLLLPFLRSRGERHPARRPWAITTVGVFLLIFVWLTALGIQAPWVPDFATEPLPAEAVGPVGSLEYQGAVLFHERGCQYCHVVLGRGGQHGPELTDVAVRLSAPEITFRIFNGIRDMPAYRDQLTPEELDAIVYFLLALPDTTVVSR